MDNYTNSLYKNNINTYKYIKYCNYNNINKLY